MKHKSDFCLPVSALTVSAAAFIWQLFSLTVVPVQADEGEGGSGGYSLPDPGTKAVPSEADLHVIASNWTFFTHFCANGMTTSSCPARGNSSVSGDMAQASGQIPVSSTTGSGGAIVTRALQTLRGGAEQPCCVEGGYQLGAAQYSFVHSSSSSASEVSMDYFRGDRNAPGCMQCTGGGVTFDGMAPAPQIGVVRQYRPRDSSHVTSLGPGRTLGFDIRVDLTSDNIGVIDVHDPSDTVPRRFWTNSEDYGSGASRSNAAPSRYMTASTSVQADDNLTDVWQAVRSLRLLANGTPVQNRAQATHVEIVNHNGTVFQFEVFLLVDFAQSQAGGGENPYPDPGPEPEESDYPDYDSYYDAWSEWYDAFTDWSYWDFYEDYEDYGGGSGPDSNAPDQDEYAARLISVTNRDGRALTIDYRSFTEAQYDESPERHWQVETVSDDFGQTITVHYSDQQVAGGWVVDQIDLPNGQAVTYEYQDEQLWRVTGADGAVSTFTTTYDTDIQHVVVEIDDPAARGDAGNQKKKLWLSGNAVLVHHGAEADFINQSSLLTHAVINGEGEVTYAQISPSHATGQLVYEGGGVAKNSNHLEASYFTGWEFREGSQGEAQIVGPKENTYVTAFATRGPEWQYGRPEAIIGEDGVRRDFEYDDAGSVNKITYGDGSFETAQYNSNHQLLRYRDRSARVTLYTYNAQGRLTSKEVGILEVEVDNSGGGSTASTSPYESGYISGYDSGYDAGYYDTSYDDSSNSGQYNFDLGFSDGYSDAYYDGYYDSMMGSDYQDGYYMYNYGLSYSDPDAGTSYDQGSGSSGGTVLEDQHQPDYAVYRWEHYSNGLLKTEFDPNWDGSSADTHRTDYEYDGHGNLTKKLGPASISGDDRPETVWTYDALNRPLTVVNPEGHEVSYLYDVNNRRIRTTYDDGSTEETLYGPADSNLRSLVVKTKDRRNVVTEYTYDLAGRVTQTIVATAWDADILDGNPDDTPITDRNEKSITSYTYLPGTDKPLSVTRDGSKTDFVYDYRARVVETKVYPYAGKTLSSKVGYVNNQKFWEEDPYGRRTYYGYRASDGAMVRVLKEAYPNVVQTEPPSNEDYGEGYNGGYDENGNPIEDTNPVATDGLQLLNIVRDTNLNPQYVIKDMVQDHSGNQIQTIDERGIQHDTTVDTRGRSIRETKAVSTPVEAITEMDYDAGGNVIEIRSPRYFDPNDTNGFEKCRTVMSYDGANRVLTRTEAPDTPEAGTESYAYDTNGRQISRTDARGKIWTTTYASCCGHSVASINPLGHGSVTNQDNGGLRVHTAGIADVATHTSLLDPDNAKTLRETTTRYDALGRSIANCTWLVPQGLIDASNPPMAGFDGISGDDGLTTQTLYDADLTDGLGLDSSTGVTVTNPLGGTYTVSLSAALSKMAEATTQGGAGLTFDASAPGSAIVKLNAENEVSFQISDSSNRHIISGILHPHDALDGATPGDLITWSCQIHDTVETIGSDMFLTSTSVDALGHTSKARSNGLGHTLQSVDQEGFISTVQYDAGGNAIVTRDPNNVGFDAVFDELNRNGSRTDTVGSQTQSVYDKAGQQVQAIDAKNKPTNYVYSARGQITTEVDRLGFATHWSYDAGGNLLSLTDAESQTTSYAYNDAGQRIAEQYPDHTLGSAIGDAGYGIITFTYDELGRRTVKEDQQGDTTTYNFDMSGRMLTRVYVGHATGTLAGQTDTDTFTYDRSGRMLSGNKERYNNTITFTYDDRGQQVLETLTTHGQTYTVRYVKNELGQTTQLQYPDGSLVDRTYTGRHLLLSVKYTPNAGTQSSVADFVYDAGGREITRNLGNGLITTRSYFNDNQIQRIATPTIENLTYAYDANKNPTSETRSGVMAPYSSTTGSSGFDNEDRLTNWSRANGDTQTWNLSPVHDWTSTAINGIVQNRTHGSAHEILTMSGADVTSGNATFTHDVKGNMTSYVQGQSFEYDNENRLKSLQLNNTSESTWTYDALGRIVSESVGDATTVFAHVERHRACKVNSNGDFSKVIYAQSIDSPVAFVMPGALFFYHTNRQHSTYSLTNVESEVVEYYSYDMFGKHFCFDGAGTVRGQHALEKHNVLFAGGQLSVATDLYYLRSRFFDTNLGRFISRDRFRYRGGRSLFAYVESNPIRYRDPWGLAPARCKCKKGQEDVSGAISALIEAQLAHAAAQGVNAVDHLNSIFVSGKGTDKGSLFGKTGIELFLEDQIKTGVLITGSTCSCTHRLLPGAGARFDSASSVVLCGQCVGTDKIGHFFGEGREYTKIATALGEKYAIALGYIMEGIMPPNMDAEILDWIENGSLTLTNGDHVQTQSVWRWWGLYGDHGLGGPSGDASPADIAANESGFLFWKDLIGGKVQRPFDICKYMKGKVWDHQKNPNVQQIPRPRKLVIE